MIALMFAVPQLMKSVAVVKALAITVAWAVGYVKMVLRPSLQLLLAHLTSARGSLQSAAKFKASANINHHFLLSTNVIQNILFKEENDEIRILNQESDQILSTPYYIPLFKMIQFGRI